MALAFGNPVHVGGELKFGAQDFVAVAFNATAVLTVVRLRNGNPGVAADSGGILTYGSDADGDPLSYEIVTQPSHGTLSAYIGGAFTFIPTPGYIGADSFVYRIRAGGEWSSPAAVDLNVDGSFAGVGVASRLRMASTQAVVALGFAQVSRATRLRVTPFAATISTQSNFDATAVTGTLRVLSAAASLNAASTFNADAILTVLRLHANTGQRTTGFVTPSVRTVSVRRDGRVVFTNKRGAV